MNISIDIGDGFHPRWKMAAGALEYADLVDDVTIVLPHSRIAGKQKIPPCKWDAVIVEAYRPDVSIPQVIMSPIAPSGAICAYIDIDSIVGPAVDQFFNIGLKTLVMAGLDYMEISRLEWDHFFKMVQARGGEPIWIRRRDLVAGIERVPKPCGVLAFNDDYGFRVLEVCRRLKLRVPGDVHVIGIDNTPACLESSPMLSSIVMPFWEVGFHAARLCRSMVLGEHVESVKIKAGGLMIRESVKSESADIRTASEVAHFLRMNMSLPIQMEDLARQSRLSRRRLEQLFREAYASSPIAYLRELRLRRAKELLRTTNTSLKEIAKTCGYRDTNHLCGAFRKELETSPLAYRRKHQV